MDSKVARRRKITIPIQCCSSGGGGAFSVEDALLAMRWAEVVRDRGYRMSFSHKFISADEVLEIYRPPHALPIAKIYRGHYIFWLTDRIGDNQLFVTLADALTSVAPLATSERRIMLKSCKPNWLWVPPTVANPKLSFLGLISHVVRGWMTFQRKQKKRADQHAQYGRTGQLGDLDNDLERHIKYRLN